MQYYLLYLLLQVLYTKTSVGCFSIISRVVIVLNINLVTSVSASASFDSSYFNCSTCCVCDNSYKLPIITSIFITQLFIVSMQLSVWSEFHLPIIYYHIKLLAFLYQSISLNLVFLRLNCFFAGFCIYILFKVCNYICISAWF